ncbi:TraM recognition domain-containing protein [Streptomyces sp. PTM05]|uniref:TraM recognition domain-containing protein n=1 Tax=Streptantibioticus parmotrematis TaxID=2873249 RepID=A0ABS7QVP0_9ACTN|nr:type IV secretory system conjugative DNA transfer family protein [Streptantibioticus parmotrematis]MBY8887259.1 TraM recognition domain-containing protein [Streptantibioticus parmotrematis]
MMPKAAVPKTAVRLRMGRDAIWVIPLIGAFVLTALLWFSAVLSGLLQHGQPAVVGWNAAGSGILVVLAHPDNPAVAWPGTGVGGPIAFWACFAWLLGGSGYGAWKGHWWWKRRGADGADGKATAAQLEKAMGEKQALGRASSLRPILYETDPTSITVRHVAVNIGVSDPTDIRLWVTIEESVVLVAPPREGKTSQIILPGILDFEGTVFATSSKTDVLYNTAVLREDYGLVGVLDPTGLSGWPNQVRWPLTAGCERYPIARKRAETLVATTKSEEGTSNGGYFSLNAKTLITCWLHAAALNKRPVADVLSWAADPDNREAVDLLTAKGRHALAEALAGQHAAAEEERSATWRTAQQSFIALYDDKVAEIFAPEGDENIFDIEKFLTEGGTLFLIGEDEEGSALAPLAAAFAKALFDTAKAIAGRAPNGRLPIPFGCFLDEMANVAPLPGIPSLMSVSGSQNIFVMAVLQSYAQAEERWGQLGVRKMMAAGTVKVFLGGISDPEELKAYSELAGDFDEDVVSISDDGDRVSVSTSLRRRAVREPVDIRMIPERGGLVIHRRTPATLVTFTRAHEGPRAEEIKAAIGKAREIVAGRRVMLDKAGHTDG